MHVRERGENARMSETQWKTGKKGADTLRDTERKKEMAATKSTVAS